MFLVIFRFFSLVSLIDLEGFSSSSHFPLTIPRSIEFASKKGGNCNNVTFGVESSRSFRSGSHVTTIIQDLTLVSLTSTMTPHPIRLLLRAMISSLLMYSTPHVLVLLLRLCTSRKNIPLKYLSKIVYLSRHAVYHPRLLQYIVRKLRYWLDTIDAFLLCGSQTRH